MKLPVVLHRSLGPVAEGFSPPDCTEQRARIHPVAPGRASTTGFIPMKNSTLSEPRMAAPLLQAMGFCTAPQGTSLPSTRHQAVCPPGRTLFFAAQVGPVWKEKNSGRGKGPRSSMEEYQPPCYPSLPWQHWASYLY